MLSLATQTDFVKRADAAYVCPDNHEFTMTFAAGAVQPATWDCPRCGQPAQLAGTSPTAPAGDTNRSHWDMVCERRTMAELAELLDQYAPRCDA